MEKDLKHKVHKQVEDLENAAPFQKKKQKQNLEKDWAKNFIRVVVMARESAYKVV